MTLKTVLIVDDSPTHREMVRIALMPMAEKVVSTYVVDGNKAVEAVKSQIANYKHNFDIIIMDFQMPGMDGQIATTQIRHLEKAENLAEENLSYIVTWSMTKHTPFKGSDAVMSKPLIPSELIAIIHSLE